MKSLLTLLFALFPLLHAAAQGYKATLIVPPSDMPTTTMSAIVSGIDYYGTTSQESLTLTVGNAGGHVYIQGIFSDYPEAWIIGTSNADKTRITFPQGQYIGEDFTLDLFVSGYTSGDVSRRSDLIIDRLSSGTIRTPEGQSFAIYYYDDYSISASKYVPFSRFTAITIVPNEKWEPATPGDDTDPTPGKDEPVIVPEGLTFIPYLLSANNIRTGAITHPASLAFDGDDVYMADFSNVALQSGAVVKGHRDGTRITFPQEQFLVNYNDNPNHPMYFYGCTYYLGDDDVQLSPLVLNYDPSHDLYTAESGLLVSDGRFRDTGLFSEFLQNVTLQGTFANITPLTTDTIPSAVPISLDGRPLHHPLPHHIYLRNGRKHLRP